MSHILSNKKKTILLANALVITTAYDRMTHLLRVLVDQDSEASFCAEVVVEETNIILPKDEKLCRNQRYWR